MLGFDKLINKMISLAHFLQTLTLSIKENIKCTGKEFRRCDRSVKIYDVNAVSNVVVMRLFMGLNTYSSLLWNSSS